MASPACPYCGFRLSRVPMRRTKCADCGKPILVRKGRLCTEDESRAIDVCVRLAIPLDRLWHARELLSEKWGRHASATDAAWGVLNQLVVESSDFNARGMVYFQMARFLWDEGRDHLELARQCRQMELANWEHAADRGLLDVRRARISVITAKGASCPGCRVLDGIELTLQEAVETMPLPVAGCTRELSPGRLRGWCRCCYALHP